jgi:uncharacterized protein
VTAAAFGSFLCSIFDEWFRRDQGRIAVQYFDEASRPLRGMDHSLCVFREICGDIPSLESSGDLYSCDHFVRPEHLLGNIRETALVDLLEGPAQTAFGRAKRDALPAPCTGCEVLDMCNGGCPKDRFARGPDGETGWNYLCAGLKQFFQHARPRLSRLEAPGDGPAFAPRVAPPPAGRNDPCPCGSGRKYKKCCGSQA